MRKRIVVQLMLYFLLFMVFLTASPDLYAKGDISAVKYLELVPENAELIISFDMRDLLDVAKKVITPKLAAHLDSKDFDDLLNHVTEEFGFDLRKLSAVTFVGRFTDEERIAVLFDAKTIDVTSFEPKEDYDGMKIYNTKGNASLAIIGKTAVVGDRKKDVEWIIDCNKGKSKSLKYNKTALNKLKNIGKSLGYDKAQLYLNMSESPDQDFRQYGLQYLALSTDFNTAIDGVLLTEPSTAEKFESFLNKEGRPEFDHEWDKLYQKMIAAKSVLADLGISEADVEKTNTFIKKWTYQRKGDMFTGNAKFTMDDLKSYGGVFIVGAFAERKLFVADEQCQTACTKLIECFNETPEQKAKCTRECTEEKLNDRPKWEKSWQMIAPFLDKSCDELKKGLEQK